MCARGRKVAVRFVTDSMQYCYYHPVLPRVSPLLSRRADLICMDIVRIPALPCNSLLLRSLFSPLFSSTNFTHKVSTFHSLPHLQHLPFLSSLPSTLSARQLLPRNLEHIPHPIPHFQLTQPFSKHLITSMHII
jgi:hypothetical protein